MSEPLVTYHADLGQWELMEPWSPPLVWVLVIPKGFHFDLASIPRVLWPILGPMELSISAPLTHDYLYRAGGFGKLSRKECDEIFLHLMELEGVSFWRRHTAYRAVRLFGGKAFKG